MSRAERKLAKLKAKEELKQIKEEKKQQKLEKQKKAQEDWNNASKGTKIVAIVIVLIIGFAVLSSIISGYNSSQNSMQSNDSTQTTQETNSEEPKPKTAQEIIRDKIIGLIDTKDAFDTGSYVKGDVPAGEYIFMPVDEGNKYYSEEDTAGNIIDNENFDSFGYVYVQGAGNIQTRGVLIKISALEKLGMQSAKEIYEKLNDVTDYRDSAMYKVGVDISPGVHTVESYGQGYVEVMSGPVGNSSIVDNEIFNGKHSISANSGQFLKVSRGKLL